MVRELSTHESERGESDRLMIPASCASVVFGFIAVVTPEWKGDQEGKKTTKKPKAPKKKRRHRKKDAPKKDEKS